VLLAVLQALVLLMQLLQALWLLMAVLEVLLRVRALTPLRPQQQEQQLGSWQES
jgi:hypothetical protein